MICRLSPKVPRGRGRDVISGTTVTCGLPVNFVTAPRLEWQQNPTETAGRSLSYEISRTTGCCGRRVDELLTKMHESNPPPKSRNKKSHLSL